METEKSHCTNTPTCWVVHAPLTVIIADGTACEVTNGFAKQTPELYDNKEVKIVSDGKEHIYKGEDILKLVDGNGNVFW